MTMSGSTPEHEPRRRQRRLVLDVAASFYDELEAIAAEDDLNINGVAYQALRNYADSRSGL